MTTVAVAICLFCQLLMVGGQLLLKHGMNGVQITPRPWPRIAFTLGAGIAALSLWFFLWLGLLSDWELSRLFPFEGLTSVLLVLGAWLFLGERVPASGWIGIALIAAGVSLVAS